MAHLIKGKPFSKLAEKRETWRYIKSNGVESDRFPRFKFPERYLFSNSSLISLTLKISTVL